MNCYDGYNYVGEGKIEKLNQFCYIYRKYSL